MGGRKKQRTEEEEPDIVQQTPRGKKIRHRTRSGGGEGISKKGGGGRGGKWQGTDTELKLGAVGLFRPSSTHTQWPCTALHAPPPGPMLSSCSESHNRSPRIPATVPPLSLRKRGLEKPWGHKTGSLPRTSMRMLLSMPLATNLSSAPCRLTGTERMVRVWRVPSRRITYTLLAFRTRPSRNHSPDEAVVRSTEKVTSPPSTASTAFRGVFTASWGAVE